MKMIYVFINGEYSYTTMKHRTPELAVLDLRENGIITDLDNVIQVNKDDEVIATYSKYI